MKGQMSIVTLPLASSAESVRIVVKEGGGYERRVESAIVLLIVLRIFAFSRVQVSA